MECTESFWQQITNTAYWQVLLALLVAFATYYFTDRSRRKAALASAKSQAIRFGYELQQAYSNRLQSELKSNYYEIIAQFQADSDYKTLFIDMARQEALANSAQSLNISQIYGKLIEEYGLIEQLARTSDYSKISKKIDKFVYKHGSLTISGAPNGTDSVEKAEAYNKQGHVDIANIIDVQIKKPNAALKKHLDKVRLKLF